MPTYIPDTTDTTSVFDELEELAMMGSAEFVSAFSVPEDADFDVTDLIDAIDDTLSNFGLTHTQGLPVLTDIPSPSSPASTPNLAKDKQPVVKQPIVKQPTAQKSSKVAKTNAAANDTKQAEVLDFRSLYGYTNALKQMEQYGFKNACQSDLSVYNINTIQDALNFSGPVLLDSFLFYGADRDDVNLLAHATMNEINWPVLEVAINSVPGAGEVITIQAPSKKRYFGPPDPKHLPMPCILFIKDLDAIKALQDKMENALDDYDDGYMHYGSNIKLSMLNYLMSVVNTGQAFVVATSATKTVDDESWQAVLGPHDSIEVLPPTRGEITELLERVSRDVLALNGLDFVKIAKLVKGASRHQLMRAIYLTSRQAMRDSLKQNTVVVMSELGIAQNVALMLDHSSELYKRITAAAVEEFSKSIDDL